MSSPLVSIVTPVFNGEPDLRECIESVIAQTHRNWQYTILNNCSTDRSREIAEEYAAIDPRIRVLNNERFVGLIDNHNLAFDSIAADSKYCKLVSADDWLYKECLERLVELAEAHPSVGIVGSYSINAVTGVKWCRLPLVESVYDGRWIARSFLLDSIDSFWVPSTVLYRSSLIRASSRFFPGTAPSADLSACLKCLLTTDLGFVHQILSFERVHSASDTSRVRGEDAYLLDRIDVLKEFGPQVLESAEYHAQLNSIWTAYYEDVLAPAVFNKRPSGFWALHRARLQQHGHSLLGKPFARAMLRRLADLMFNPKATLEKVLRRATESASR